MTVGLRFDFGVVHFQFICVEHKTAGWLFNLTANEKVEVGKRVVRDNELGDECEHRH